MNYSNVATSNNMCHNCTKRDVYCHDYCEEYLEWKKKLNEKNRKIHEENRAHQEFCSYHKKVENPYSH